VLQESRATGYLAALLWAIAPPAPAAVLLAGYGQGDSAEAARAEARHDLAYRLGRLAASHFDGKSGSAIAYRAIAGGRELPLIGIELVATGGSRIEARLTDASLAAYRSEAAKLGQSLRALQRSGLQPSAGAAAQLTRLLAQLDQYRRIDAVMELFRSPLSPQTGPEDATLRRWALQHLPALDDAAQVARRVKSELERAKVGGVRVIAPVRADSAEITGLSGSIGDALRAELGAPTPDRSMRYTLDGSYERVDKKILLTLYLMNSSFSTERAFAYVLPGDLEKAFRSPPPAAGFSGTLSRGLVRIQSLDESATPAARPPQARDGGLVVEVQTGRGNRGLYYRPGDRDQLLVRLDRQGYYYVVGHIEKENTHLSYLMEIGQGTGNRFVRRVGAGEANRWQTVGEFVVEPPLGVEAVQVFATSEPPDRMLPAAKFDPARQLYVIGNNPVDAIARTRGLVRIEMGAAAVPAVGEAVLQFTTLQ